MHGNYALGVIKHMQDWVGIGAQLVRWQLSGVCGLNILIRVPTMPGVGPPSLNAWPNGRYAYIKPPKYPLFEMICLHPLVIVRAE